MEGKVDLFENDFDKWYKRRIIQVKRAELINKHIKNLTLYKKTLYQFGDDHVRSRIESNIAFMSDRFKEVIDFSDESET
jgi:hypothetical protein